MLVSDSVTRPREGGWRPRRSWGEVDVRLLDWLSVLQAAPLPGLPGDRHTDVNPTPARCDAVAPTGQGAGAPAAAARSACTVSAAAVL